MYHKLLVPLDGSARSESAIQTAVSLLKNSGESELLLLRIPVIERLPLLYSEAMVPVNDGTLEQYVHCQKYLKEIEAQITAPGVRVSTRVAWGDPASVIVNTAVSEHVDLVVMAQNGRRGVTRWILGSVTSRVLQSCPIPVLVSQDGSAIKHILLPLDGSELAEQAVGPALEIAQKFEDCTVTLLHIIETPVDFAGTAVRRSQMIAGQFEYRRQQAFKQAKRYLDQVTVNHFVDGVKVKTAVLESSLIGDAIIRTAEDKKCDLIAMATHGYTGLKKWVYGSVTEKVLGSTPASMLVVRVPEHDLQNEINSFIDHEI